jgi:hypothetical protein
MKIMKRSNNTILLLVLLVLSGGFVLSRVFRTPSLESNLDEHLLTLDTGQIRAIHIDPASEKGEIKLVRSGSKWEVQRDKATARVEVSQVKNALESIREIHPERIVTRKKEKWADYKVDTTGTKVQVFTGASDPTEFWIGKTSSGEACVRLAGDDNVYEVNEPLERNFNKQFAAWRDKTFLKVEPGNVSKITFEYPADSSFVLERSDGKWNVQNVAADSAKVENYLNRFKSRTLSQFADNFSPTTAPAYVVKLHNGPATVLEVKGWKNQENSWVVTSSVQNGVYFSSDDSTLMNQLFAGRKVFVGK